MNPTSAEKSSSAQEQWILSQKENLPSGNESKKRKITKNNIQSLDFDKSPIELVNPFSQASIKSNRVIPPLGSKVKRSRRGAKLIEQASRETTPPKIIRKPKKETTPVKKGVKKVGVENEIQDIEKPLKIMLQGDACSENYKKIITVLGGTLVSDISDHFDVLVASQLKRSPKLLQAFNLKA